MLALTDFLTAEPEIRKLLHALNNGASPAVTSGLSPIHRTHLAAAIARDMARPIVIVCADELDANRFALDLQGFTGVTPLKLFTRDFTFYNAEGVSRELEQRRIHALYALTQVGETAEAAPLIVVTAAPALLQRTLPPNTLRASSITVSIDGTYNLDDLTHRLVAAGYTRAEQAEGAGQFAIRGGILDFFSPAAPQPVRCEFFGDEIDGMSYYDPQTQRRTENVTRADVIPCAESLTHRFPGGDDALADALEARVKLLGRRASQKWRETVAGDCDRLRDRRSLAAADRYMELIYDADGFATPLDYLPTDAVLLFSDPNRVRERAESYLKQLGEECSALLESGVLESSQVRFAMSFDELTTRAEDFPQVYADSFLSSSYPTAPRALTSLLVKQLPSYGGSLDTAAGDISHYCRAGYRTVVICADERRADNLRDFLTNREIPVAVDLTLASMPDEGFATVTVGSLSAGMEYPSLRLAVITEGQFSVTDTNRRAKKARKQTNRERVASFTDLSPGDLVVHEHHGIGRYVGLEKLQVDGLTRDYIKIAYAGSDSLFLPATQLDLVSKYIGGGEDAPVRLHKMGGAEWEKTKSRAKSSARDMAKELIELYAARQRARGHAFAPDSIWQSEFEDRFGYTETDDQLRSISEIKSDMEQPVPMDRLLCGDVGYGKTEVALRAVMKCVLDGYQAAILVPTTVLAQQHFTTASRRFAGVPVSIEVLSRFRSPAEVKKARKGLEVGSVDIVIGTHSLLQKDIKFKKLGLLVVDEEQRFGVSHKERLKELSKSVDVLTLSATPIPRTLNMALSGIRDMSTIEEPPMDRQPVQTYVMEHDYGVLIDAMRREIARGGQVYYLHNRVSSIDRTAARLSAMLNGDDMSEFDAQTSTSPTKSRSKVAKSSTNIADNGAEVTDAASRIVVAVAHGKMDEDALGDTMDRLASGEVSVLVCTTIIETGIDIPNVNTLIIEDADKLGLAQLHQIRGRVGRSPRRAYAYLTFRRGKVLTEIAEKRLGAIREFAEFNSGFKIAMRDLEIRGAGSLLGAEQSGHMMKVGYDMYLKLLEEAVIEERGEKPKKRVDCSADLAVSAYLPDSYVPSGEQRVDLYRRIARVRTEEDADEMISELIDRYGDPPASAVALVEIARIRADAAEAGITEIAQKDGQLRCVIADFDIQRVSALYALPEYTGRVRVEAGSVPAISLRLKGNRVLDEASRFIRAFK
ncbi:MAG: transcription-repair coupling factor [Oscillospiraceae bacterium]|jgi:transcription-repair coupling factor (superfamily II helicase)|nr:transcription-repair coupling factor [Oscillospiraceae bacterium]